MPHIPKDAQSFLAQHVEEIQVGSRKGCLVHINYVLVEAKTPSEAYRKSLALGKETNAKYKNRAGETVIVRFLELGNLDVIQDPLEHRCEVMFSEHVGIVRAQIQKLVRKKEKLEVFRPVRSRSAVPDYASRNVWANWLRAWQERAEPYLCAEKLRTSVKTNRQSALRMPVDS